MQRIVSLLPAATEIGAALGLLDEVVGVSHECDFPKEANKRPRVTHCPVHNVGLTSREVDEWVGRALRENGTIYTIDEPLLRKLRPDCDPDPEIVRCVRSRLRALSPGLRKLCQVGHRFDVSRKCAMCASARRKCAAAHCFDPI